jgi:2-keto-4-pentenoate hydratase/2-oxohepta-3-ene-1,7-dioic acid hydratase in catechol pathway
VQGSNGCCASRIAPPHFIAIGLNYADHAAESVFRSLREPVMFSKAPSCVCGAN